MPKAPCRDWVCYTLHLLLTKLQDKVYPAWAVYAGVLMALTQAYCAWQQACMTAGLHGSKLA